MDINNALVKAISNSFEGIILTDPNQNDNPIVYANDAFCNMTGYTRDEVLGKNCRFLQGKDTDPNTLQQIARSVNCETGGIFQVYNYKKNGEGFWNRLAISPVKDKDGVAEYFVGFQTDVTDIYNAQNMLNKQQKDLTDILSLINFDVMKTVQNLEEDHGHEEEIKRICAQLIHQISLMITIIKDNSTEIMDIVSVKHKR